MMLTITDVNLFNFIGFTLLLANGGWLIHIWILESHRQTTWVPPWVNLLFFLGECDYVTRKTQMRRVAF
jgi:hypothetical protein